MKKRLFLGVDPLLNDANFEFELMTEAEVEQAEKEAESIYEYLTVSQYQNWVEVTCSWKNLQKLEQLCQAMRRELGA